MIGNESYVFVSYFTDSSGLSETKPWEYYNEFLYND